MSARGEVEGCEHSDRLRGMLIEVEPRVVRAAVDATARGRDWGVLAALTCELLPESAEEEGALALGSASGIFVGPMPIAGLVRIARTIGDSPPLEIVVAQLEAPPPDGQIHVLGLLGSTVATVTVSASPAIVAARDRHAARLTRIHEMLRQAEPVVLNLARDGHGRVLVALPDDSLLDRLTSIAAGGRDAARSTGLYIGAHAAADLILALPLEQLEHGDAVRLSGRLMRLVPRGLVEVIAVFDGHITRVTVEARPGCLARLEEP